MIDLERLMILLQRRYNFIREIRKLTDELQETYARNDLVSATMVLHMRADEMMKCDQCIHEIWEMAEAGMEEAALVKQMMMKELPEFPVSGTPEEKKIYEIRQKTDMEIKHLKEVDRTLNQRIGGEKSFYAKDMS